MACGSKKTDPKNFRNEKEKFSFLTGNDIGSYLKQIGKENIDMDALFSGIEHSLDGKKPPFNAQQAQQIKMKYMQSFMKKSADKNKQEGEKFLAENKKKEGVTTTASGLQYIVQKKGSGPKPTANDKVKVHYRGTLLNGEEFDSSYKRGQPIEFQVKGVIPGWTEALQLMPVGSKYKLFIPSSIGYGDRGAGQKIKPGSTLIFEVELLDIVK